MKKCRICNNLKVLNEFHKKKDTKDGYRNECKDCIKIILKKYKENPYFKEKQKKYDKKRYNEKRNEILNNKKKYYNLNKIKILEYKKEYRKNSYLIIKKWRKNNKERLSYLQKNYRKRYPYIIAWRSILHSTLKRLNTNKEGKNIDILGYNALDLKNHLQSKFKKGMSWDNYGNWHIDHIKPVSLFNKETPISIVCSLNNLQPLWKEENLSKSNKIF